MGKLDGIMPAPGVPSLPVPPAPAVGTTLPPSQPPLTNQQQFYYKPGSQSAELAYAGDINQYPILLDTLDASAIATFPSAHDYYYIPEGAAPLFRLVPGIGNTIAVNTHYFTNSSPPKQLSPPGTVTAQTIQPTGNGLIVAMRPPLPLMQVTIDGGAAGAFVELWLIDQADCRHSGIHDPYSAGKNLEGNVDILAIGGTITRAIDLYSGPAQLYIQGSAGSECSAYIRYAGSLLPIMGVLGDIPPAGNLGCLTHGDVDVWIPPFLTELVVINGGVAQTVRTTIVAK